MKSQTTQLPIGYVRLQSVREGGWWCARRSTCCQTSQEKKRRLAEPPSCIVLPASAAPHCVAGCCPAKFHKSPFVHTACLLAPPLHLPASCHNDLRRSFTRTPCGPSAPRPARLAMEIGSHRHRCRNRPAAAPPNCLLRLSCGQVHSEHRPSRQSRLKARSLGTMGRSTFRPTHRCESSRRRLSRPLLCL